jgi:beta-mannosidase
MSNKNRNRIYLDKNWKFSLNKIPDGLMDNFDIKIKPKKIYNAVVPGTIHTDLLNNKLIVEPFYSDNEKKLAWIEECDWTYQTEFNLDGIDAKNYNIVFEGLDTISEIFLNNNKILTTENMFLQYRSDVSKELVSGKNVLKINFISPIKYSKQKEIKFGKLEVALNSSRVYIRKAQYSFGWDWGPIFPTSGIWKNIYIEEQPKIKINNFSFQTNHIENKKALVGIKINFDKIPTSKNSIEIELSSSNQITSKNIKSINKKSIYTEIEIQNPELWWTNGEGDQNLYLLKIKILDDANNVIDEVNKKVGIRTVELLHKENSINVFKFKINDKIIFAKGANWIPSDSFLPRITDSKYFSLLKVAKDANMNIIRVWGGGIYENDKFYEICDELGLMVWQDFMFACASYPKHKEFIENVKNEVVQNVMRLQYHPSIIIWCGNNENEWIWYQDQKISYKKMPGYKIYHSVIPNILKSIDPVRPYWPSSPFSFDEDPNSYESGNRHQWDIWSRWIDYEQVKNDKSLFVTEFGFQAPANLSTLEKCLPVNNRKIHDSVFEFHNKQVEGTERVIRFLSHHLPLSTKFDDFIYLAQLNQAFALDTCLKHWRTNGKTFGSIIWQLNDCWPVTSWSLIDSELMPKLSYHFVKNIFSQQIIFFEQKDEIINVKVQNQSSIRFNGKFNINFIEAFSGKILNEYSENIYINKKSDKNIYSFPFQKMGEQAIVYATLKNENNEQINFSFFNKLPWKYYLLTKVKISIKIQHEKGKTKILLKSNKPAYFVDLFANGITFEKRGFSLMPNEEITVDIIKEGAAKLKISDIKIDSLNNYLV